MAEGGTSAEGFDLELLRSGIRLMALRAIGDSDAADEVAQESLARAVDVLRSPERTANIGAYVAGIARHVIADYFRAKDRVISIDQLDQDVLYTDSIDPLTALCTEDDLARMRLCLMELSVEDHELVRLCYFEDLTPTEIADRLGVPPERIRQRKLRALQRLRVAFHGVPESRHATAFATTIRSGVILADARGSIE